MKTIRAALGGLLLSAWGVAAPSPSLAQSLLGTVRETGGEPVPGANVLVEGTARGAATDAAGAFRLDGLAPGAYRLVVRAVGYRTETRPVTLGAADVRVAVVLRAEDVAGDEVVVEDDAARRAREGSQATSVLTEADLAATRGQTLGAALERLPGVTTLTTGPSIAKPVLRGLHSERVVVVNAGVAQEGQQWGGEHAPEIDPFAPARVEVLRGVAGVEYGVGAMGGVVRLVPRELPETPGVGGEAILNAFSNNRQGAGSLLVEGATAAVAGLGWRTQLSGRRAGDARAPGYGLVNSGFAEGNALAAVGLHRRRFGLDVQASRFATTLGVFKGAHVGNADDLRRAYAAGEPAVRGPFSYRIEAPKQAVAHGLVAARGHVDNGAGDRVEVHYGFQHNRRREYDAHYRGQTLPEGRLAFDLTLRTHTLDLRLQPRPLGDAVVVAGLTGTNQANVNGAAGQLIPNFRALTGGAFARVSWARGPLTLDAGGRYDGRRLTAYPRAQPAGGAFVRRVTDYGAATGAAGARWAFAPGWSLAANVGTAWRPPSVNELYSYGVHHGTGRFEVGDRTLGRERSAGFDATLRHDGRLATATASAFVTGFDRFLYLRPDTALTTTFRGAFPTFRHVQTDARLYGLDGDVEVRPGGPLVLSATASVVRGDDRGRGEPLYGMPADRVALGLGARLPRRPAFADGFVGVEARLVRRQTRVPSLADFAPPPAGYALVGLRASGTVRLGAAPVAVAVSADNLFDVRHRDYLSRFRYFADDPGRNVALRLTVPFGARRP